MRKQKSTVTLLALALVLAFGAVPVMAAEDTVPPTIPTVYPIEVHSSESGGVYRLEKVYCLGTKDDPAAIPTQSFERGKYRFNQKTETGDNAWNVDKSRRQDTEYGRVV